MLGIMHYDRDGAPAFVFDMMEPERPKVDTAVLGFLKSEAIVPEEPLKGAHDLIAVQIRRRTIDFLPSKRTAPREAA